MLCLKAYHDGDKLQEIELGNATLRIGRNPQCDLVLADLSVSREHAQIEPHGNFYVIRDNGSTNGTFVNDREVLFEVLRPGDAIRIGKFILKLDADREKRGDTSKIRIKALPTGIFEKIELESSGAEQAAAADAPTEAIDARVRLIRLSEIQHDLGYVDSLPALVDRSLQRMLHEVDADRGCILLGDFQRSESVVTPRDLAPAAIATREGAVDAEEAELVVPQDLLRFILEEKSATAFDSGEAGSTRHCLAAPFLADDRLLGLAYLERDVGRSEFVEDDVRFLTLIASLVSVAITNALLFEEIFAEKEKLQAVMTGLSEGVCLTDPRLRIIEANARAGKLLGEDESLIGRRLFDLSGRFTFSVDEEVVLAELEEGTCRLRMHEHRGDRTLDVRIAEFTGPVSGFMGCVVHLRDASEDRRIEEKKTEFIRSVAHKLRTPLTLIEGNLPLLHGEISSEPAGMEILRDVEKGSRALCELVDEFVGFMEMEMWNLRSTSAVEESLVHDLVWEAIEKVKSQASSKRILVNNKIKGDFPSVLANPARLVQALSRIMENAVKFSPDGGVITVEGESDGVTVRLHIADEGPGIPESQRESVFDLFHQVDEETTGEVPGIGLGLPIARQIVQEHGGDITLASPHRAADSGLCVTVILPIAPSGSGGGATAGLGERVVVRGR